MVDKCNIYEQCGVLPTLLVDIVEHAFSKISN